MTDFLRKQKSPLMTYSTFINSNYCQNCVQLKETIDQKEYQIRNLLARERDLIELVEGDQSYRNYRQRIEEFELSELKLKKINEQLQHDLLKSEHHNQQLSISYGNQQQQIMDLKSQLLQLEKNLLIHGSEKNLQTTINGLEEQIEQLGEMVINQQHKHSSEQKFISSILHMVVSCHPDNHFKKEPSLKAAWKWLKHVLQEYVILKKHSK